MIRGAQVVPDKIKIGRRLFQRVVKRAFEVFERSPGSQIRPADSDHKKYIRIISDLLCRLFNSVELFFVIIHRKIDPSEEIISCACSGKQFFLRLRSKLAHIFHLVLLHKTTCF